MNPMTEEYLEHHDILGQKWGVRRFQNKNGSLTTKGKKRLNSYVRKQHKKKERITNDRKKDLFESRASLKDTVNRNRKEAEDRVEFYGGKNVAKNAIKQEAAYASKVARGKAFVTTAKGLGVGAFTGSALGLTSGEVATFFLCTAGGGAAAAVAAGSIGAIKAAKTIKFIKQHAEEQVSYTDDVKETHKVRLQK